MTPLQIFQVPNLHRSISKFISQTLHSCSIANVGDIRVTSIPQDIKKRASFFSKFVGAINDAKTTFDSNPENTLPFPIKSSLYAEYLVMEKLLCLGYNAMHNQEKNAKCGRRWPQDLRRDSVDICILSQTGHKGVEVKYSGDYGSTRSAGKWQFQNISPSKFDFLVLVAEAKPLKFLIFTKEDTQKYIPFCDWSWKETGEDHKWIGIYDSPEQWQANMKKWKPEAKSTIDAKAKFMESKTAFVGFIATHMGYFEDRWDKFKP